MWKTLTTPEALTAGAAAVLLALVHLHAGKLRFLDVIPRSRWLSLAGGISVAYVFLHLLPELEESQAHLRERWPEMVKYPANLVALVGLGVFYGLERWVIRGKRSGGAAVFWLHTGAFAGYNLIIGYLLLHRLRPGWLELGLYILAMGVHFVVNDYGLRAHHQHRYRGTGRWILAAAVVGGYALGLVEALPETTLVVLFSFIAGGTVLNVLKEELPAERESRFLPFAAGLAAFAALLLTI